MTDRPLLDALATSFLRAARTATLATTAPDDRPRLVPICFVLGGDATDPPDAGPMLYSPLDDKPKKSDDPHDLARVRDLLIRPHATLLVDRWSEDWSRLAWLRLETRAELVEPDAEPGERTEHAAAVAALRAKYPQYATHRLDQRPLLRFTVTRALAWGALDGD